MRRAAWRGERARGEGEGQGGHQVFGAHPWKPPGYRFLHTREMGHFLRKGVLWREDALNPQY